MGHGHGRHRETQKAEKSQGGNGKSGARADGIDGRVSSPEVVIGSPTITGGWTGECNICGPPAVDPGSGAATARFSINGNIFGIARIRVSVGVRLRAGRGTGRRQRYSCQIPGGIADPGFDQLLPIENEGELKNAERKENNTGNSADSSSSTDPSALDHTDFKRFIAGTTPMLTAPPSAPKSCREAPAGPLPVKASEETRGFRRRAVTCAHRGSQGSLRRKGRM